MTRLLVSLALLIGFAAPVHAEGPMLVELFASKNCRACPAAYKTMKQVEAERGKDVIVLTWAVDYWDYLGGKEKMALPESKDRQRAYVDHFSMRGPYTPQTVYNGLEQASGNKPAKVGAAMMKAEMADPTDVRLQRAGKRVVLTGQPDGLADIWWVAYLDAATTRPRCRTRSPACARSARGLAARLRSNCRPASPAASSSCRKPAWAASSPRCVPTSADPLP
jgi:hypothetical protein